MASSITLKTNSGKGTYGGRYLQLDCTQVKNVSNNQSTINWTLSSVGGSATYYSVGPTTVKINGVTVYSNERVNYTAQVFPAKKGSVSGSTVVTHSNDGTKTISISVTTAVYYAASEAQTFTSSWTLDAINRISTLTCANTDIGKTANIAISRYNSSLTTTVTYAFGSLSGTLATKTSSSSIYWTIPTSFYNQIPNAPNGEVTLTATTYNGSTSIGTSTCKFKAIANEELSKPTLSPYIYDSWGVTTNLTGNNQILILGYSTARASSGASARNGSTLSTESIVCGGKTVNSSSGIFSDPLSNVFTFTAKDSRGYTTVQTVTKTIVPYLNLSCSLNASAPTISGNATLNISGDYFNGSFGAQNNSLTVQYRYMESNDEAYSDWANVNVTIGANSYSGSVTISSLDYTKTYLFQVKAADRLNTIITEPQAESAEPIFEIGNDACALNRWLYLDSSISFGKEDGQTKEWGIHFTSKDGGTYSHDIYVGGGSPTSSSGITVYDRDNSRNILNYIDSANYTVLGDQSTALWIDTSRLYINDTRLADFVVDEGTSGIWNYRKWNSGKAECWGTWTGTLSHYTTTNGFYAYYTSVSFPSGLFNATPVPAYSAGVGSVFALSGNIGSLSKTAMNCYALASSGGSQSVKFCIHANGTWK